MRLARAMWTAAALGCCACGDETGPTQEAPGTQRSDAGASEAAAGRGTSSTPTPASDAGTPGPGAATSTRDAGVATVPPATGKPSKPVVEMPDPAAIADADGGSEPDQDAGPVIPMGPSGSFLALTYNVAGLPEGLSSSMPQRFTPLIGPLLNGYDLVLLQESWLTPDPNPFTPLRGYHELLVASSEHPYKSVPAPQPFGSNPSRLTALLSDGLNVFSRYAFSETERAAWPRCVDSDADCLAMKGFSMSPVTLDEGIVVHVYNLHMEAGDTAQDDAARAEGLQQMLTFMEQRSKDQAVIMAGDFNLRTDTEPAGTQFSGFVQAAGLTDACAALSCERPGSIDKLLVRSSANVTLRLESWRLENDVFISDTGEKLSDHDPIAVRIRWSAATP